MRLIFVVLLGLLSVSPVMAQQPGPAAVPAPAPPPVAPALTPGSALVAPSVSAAQAQQLLDILRDDRRRAELAQVLETLSKVAPSQASSPAPSSSSAAAPMTGTAAPSAAAPGLAPGAPAAATPVEAPSTGPLQADSLGAMLLVQVSHAINIMSERVVAVTRAARDLPLLWSWVVTTANDPAARARIADAAWKLAVVMAAALIAEFITRRLLRRAIRGLAEAAPPLPSLAERREAAAVDAQSAGLNEAARARGHRRLVGALKALRRVPFVLLRLGLELIPVLVVGAVGNLLMGTILGERLITRLAILAVVNAYVLCRAIMAGVRTLVSVDHPRLRLFPMTDRNAAYILVWMWRLTAVAVFGFGAGEVGLLFGLYRSAHDAVFKLVMLIDHVFVIIIIMQCRGATARLIRARDGQSGVLAVLRNKFAAIWHWVATFYVVALWVIWAIELRNGYSRLLQFFLTTTAVIIISRLVAITALAALDRGFRVSPELASRFPGLEAQANRYYPILRRVVSTLIFMIGGLVLLQAWGLDSFAWFEAGQLGGRVLSALTTLAITIVIAAMIWEGTNTAIQHQLSKLSRGAQVARAARLRTLLPMLRTALMSAIFVVVGLIALSEIGVNIAPLLAGAGVLGLAVGFGSQKLVQDLITGLFLLLENAIQVGDVVSLGGLAGTVEHLSIRTIRLRALDGSVHIVPFSAVTTVTNLTKDFSYALCDVTVGLDEEPDRIADLLRDIVKQMRREPRWEDAITSDLDVMGVEKFTSDASLMRVRIRTAPSQRWAVGREFNRRVKYKFDELAIQSPITSYRAQGWLPPGAAFPIPKHEPNIPVVQGAPP